MYKHEGYTVQEIEAMQLPEGTRVVDYIGNVHYIDSVGEINHLNDKHDFNPYHIIAETPPVAPEPNWNTTGSTVTWVTVELSGF